MRFNKTFILVILISVVFSTAFSQKQLREEFIVKSPGDTIRGTVEVKGNSHYIKQVEFQSTSGQLTSYSIDEIIGFYDKEWGLFVSGTVTFSYKGHTNGGTDKVETLISPPEKVFLEVMIRGNGMTFYYFKSSERGEHFYIANGDETPNELYQLEQQIETNGTKKIKITKLYQQTLQGYLKDCPTITSKILGTSLSRKSIIKLIKQYYGCINAKVDYESKVDEGESFIGITAGYSTSRGIYSSESAPEYPITATSNFFAGVSFDYVFSKRSRRVTLLDELVYRNSEIDWRITSSSYATIVDYKYTMSYLRLNTMVRYYLLKPSLVKPFLLAGISNSFAISSDGTQTFTYPASGTATYTTNKLDVRGYEQGLIIGAGVSYQKLDLYFRWETTNGFIPNNNTENTSVKNLYFGIAYRFTKPKD